jgi:DNA polymerase III subunit delta
MRIASDQLAKRLDRELGNFYLLFGDETLLVEEAANLLRARKVFVVDTGFDWSALLAERDALSLFADKRLLELRIPGGKPGKEGGQALQDYVARLPEATLTVVSLPAVDRATQASKWFQTLEGSGVTVEARSVGREQLPRWLRERLAVQQQDADPETLEFLAAKVEGNLLAAHQEVQKLGLLFGPGELSLDAVRGAVVDVARFDVFALGPAILSGDQVQFVRVLEGLRGEGIAPPLVLWALAEEARTVGRVLASIEQGSPLAQAMRDARVWGARQNLLPQAVRRIDQAMLRAALDHASLIDRQIKGLAKGDVWDELLQLGLGLMRRAADRTRAGNPSTH